MALARRPPSYFTVSFPAYTDLQIALRYLKQSSWAYKAVEWALQCLTDKEVRVRLAVADCLGEATHFDGVDVWELVKTPILDNIHHCWVHLCSKK